jgi:predicted nucleotidyltransferase
MRGWDSKCCPVLQLKNLPHSAFRTIRQIRTSAPVETGIEHAEQSGGYHEDVMSPHLALDRGVISAFCERHHIARLALFGSALGDQFGPDSDVDVLVEFQPGHVPGLEFLSIERELSALLRGRRVDLVTPKFLNARIREQVLREAEPIYVAA